MGFDGVWLQIKKLVKNQNVTDVFVEFFKLIKSMSYDFINYELIVLQVATKNLIKNNKLLT